MEFYLKSSSDILKELESDSKIGLKESEIESRVSKYGVNQLPQKRSKSIFEIFLLQFKSPIIYVLLIASIISFSIGEFTDAYFIFAVLIINAIIGTYQEFSANQKADSLKKIVKTYCTVLRDGTKKRILSKHCSVGDIVYLESGDKVPADIRLIESSNLKVNESLLTGESMDILKDSDFKSKDETLPIADRLNIVYGGSFISSGRAKGVVVSIGAKSEVGKIASLLASDGEGEIPLIKKMEKFSLDIAKVILIASIFIFVVGYFQGMSVRELFFLAVAMSVSAIPEGLPVAITIALTSASLVMSKRNVIIRKLASIEGLGSCTFIASDKTGTLTKNSLSVERFISSNGEIFQKSDELSNRVYRCAILCNEADIKEKSGEFKFFGDQVDIALAKFVLQRDKSYRDLNFKILSEIPYESHNRYSAISVEIDGDSEQYIKGSPETILNFCNISEDEKRRVLDLIDEFSSDGYRNIALATKSPNNGDSIELREFNFLGFVAIIDPIREESKEAIERAQMAGIKVAMVTGDHPNTAFAIAKELNITKERAEVISGEELNRWSERGGSIEEIKDKRVFARVTPEQKQKIILTFQELGNYVAVTGDGVNDAPALKYSNIGIAMGRDGTDVARESSDLILTDDNFKSIVNGIEEGRIAYSNIRKVTYLLVSTGFAELVLIILALLFTLPIPLLPVQLLWLNLVTNGIQHIALGIDRSEPNILKRKPRSPDEKIFNYYMIRRVLVGGLYMGVMAFSLFYLLINSGYSEDMARNITLLLMVLFENVHVFNSRSESVYLHKINHLRNRFLLLAVAMTQVIHITSMYIPFMQDLLSIKPVEIETYFTLLVMALGLMFVMEFDKYLTKRRFKFLNLNSSH